MDALPEACQPPNLTEVLQRCGVLGPGARVGDVAIERSWPTVLSRLIRLRLSYEGSADGAAASLIFKTGLPERINAAWNSGRHEVAFYTQVAAEMQEPLVPRCFDAQFEEETKGWHLLLEDLTDSHRIATQWPLPPSFEQMQRIIAGRARFHAAWWDDPRLGTSISTWAAADEGHLDYFAGKFAAFADAAGDLLSDDRRRVYQRLIEEGHRLNARYRSHRDLTIVHGDAHVWNIFLPRDDSDDTKLFDWDCWRLDVATDDLAYMMALHWFPEHRRQYEKRLLDHYRATLVQHGVTGYDRQALDDDYRLSALWQIATPVWQWSNSIPPLIWWNNLERIFLAVDDLGCRDLLG